MAKKTSKEGVIATTLQYSPLQGEDDVTDNEAPILVADWVLANGIVSDDIRWAVEEFRPYKVGRQMELSQNCLVCSSGLGELISASVALGYVTI